MPIAPTLFRDLAAAALRDRGEAATITRVAEVIGEHPNAFGRHVQ